ncbi:LOW QUALITY PROTEIN: receptor-type tyrosine-protein phosphatase N2 [Perognathus longimembris pacificus]|uniref:LOW QUALITY PROTEIN: receptor-type tyrosine-protein phosphatase N2 n=1 Tax=Perognathus longimembris pacificus TaxID=214514 RepID=UPI002018D5FB|nr:LOW QUALITY PROTEIN: receptor-type tyrosine-protein phosphatase N2 [Perognathus longimembris pacificus]
MKCQVNSLLCLLPTDGVFGRCQKVPAIHTYRYEVAPGALQHLKVTLQKLSRAGLTWQDGLTQRVMAQELSSLPRAYPRHLETSGPTRTIQQDVDSEQLYGPENEIALAKTLQHYLPYLGILSQATSSSVHPRVEQETVPAKGEDSFPENVLTYVAHASALTYPPLTRARYPESLPVRTPGQFQPDKLSPEADNGVDRQHLATALSAYAAQKPSGSSREGDSILQNLLNPSRVPRPPLAPEAAKKWPSPAGDPEDSPGMDTDAILRSLLKDLWKHQAKVERQGLLQLDEAADTMAGAAHGVRPGEGQASLRRGAEGRPAGQADGLETAFQGHREQEESDPMGQEVRRLSVQLGGLLQDRGSPLSSEIPLLEKPSKTETKKSEEPAASLSSEEETVGVENVRSQTYSKDLLEKQPNWEPSTLEGGHQSWALGLGQGGQSLQAAAQPTPREGLQLEVKSPEEGQHDGYIMTSSDPLGLDKGKQLMDEVARLLQVPASIFVDIDVLGPAVTFKVSANARNVTAADVERVTVDHKEQLEWTLGLTILRSGVGPKAGLKLLPHESQDEQEDSTKFIVLTFLSVACIAGVLLASGLLYCLRHGSHHKLKEKLSGLGAGPSTEATAAYQELCRRRMAARPPDRPEGPPTSRISSVSSQLSDGPLPSPTARSSTSSWSEEPVQSTMDISTGHMVLAYMEDHLRNKNRLDKEWEALCTYQAEPNSSLVAQREENVPKNRSPAVLTYDHSRILLNVEHSLSNSDYINASPIMDHDPKNPAYIATQGPLPSTVADFWQMVWESRCAVIVMLTPLAENGVRQCHRYWPDEGSDLYHIYEVHLVSEHIWCQDFLVRSFYLKNLQTSETRTVTQFHFLSWYNQGVPSSTRSLLDFRRKVNKSYRGRSCPIIVHCSDGAGRSGTYVLIDMVLNKMAKGAKEIDIAATLEHLRDQRPGMVQTKEQFEFALTAVAEEVNAILKALPQ